MSKVSMTTIFELEGGSSFLHISPLLVGDGVQVLEHPSSLLHCLHFVSYFLYETIPLGIDILDF